MGLDIYLEQCSVREEADRLEAEHEEKTTAIWDKHGKKYKDMTQAEKDECSNECDQLAEKLGLDKWGTHQQRKTVSIDSQIDPEHYFKIGYFRSSYNDSGINSVLRQMGLETLDYIFDYTDDEYHFVPDWNKSAIRAAKLLEKYNEQVSSSIGKYRSFEISHNMFKSPDKYPDSEQEAMELFAKEIERQHGDCKAYSNGAGEFYLDGQKVFGFIPGKRKAILRDGYEPCVYIITENSEDSIEWYRKALMIIKETIDYVLAQKDADTYYLKWSG